MMRTARSLVLLVLVGAAGCATRASSIGVASGPRADSVASSSGSVREASAAFSAVETRMSREPGASAIVERGIPMPEPAREPYVREPMREMPTPQVPIPFVPDRGGSRGSWLN